MLWSHWDCVAIHSCKIITLKGIVLYCSYRRYSPAKQMTCHHLKRWKISICSPITMKPLTICKEVEKTKTLISWERFSLLVLLGFIAIWALYIKILFKIFTIPMMSASIWVEPDDGLLVETLIRKGTVNPSLITSLLFMCYCVLSATWLIWGEKGWVMFWVQLFNLLL